MKPTRHPDNTFVSSHYPIPYSEIKLGSNLKLELIKKLSLWLIVLGVTLGLVLALFNLSQERPVILKVNTTQKVVALTFDDGPDPRYTPEVLDILKRYHIKGTFFVVGKNVENNPQIAARCVTDGNELGNHTYDHPKVLTLSNDEMDKEIRVDNQIISKLTAQKVVWFRPPRREYTQATLKTAETDGLRTVLWTVCLENQNVKTPAEMAKRVFYKVRPGSIVLAHDGILNRSKSVEALPLLIQDLQNQGYKFVTLTELMKYQQQ